MVVTAGTAANEDFVSPQPQTVEYTVTAP